MMKAQALRDLKFGMIAIHKKFADKEQIKQALEVQRRIYEQNDRYIEVGDILVQSGILTKVQRDMVCATQNICGRADGEREEDPEMARKRNKERFMERRFGLIAVKKGYAGRSQVDRALFLQQMAARDNIHILIGDLLVESEEITPEQRDEILAIQKRGGVPLVEAVGPPVAEAAEDEGETGGVFTIDVAADGMTAVVRIEGGSLAGITPEAVKKRLTAEGVTHGILEDRLLGKRLAQEGGEPTGLQVAAGTAAEPGRDARVIYHCHGDEGDRDASGPGFCEVKKGDLVAEKVPATEGRPGCDVYGQPIPPVPGSDLSLAAGAGTRLSADGNRLTATDDGCVEVLPGGAIGVYPYLRIPGDAGKESGDIEFDGHIEIEGALGGGIRVRGRSLRVNEVYNSRIELSGDLHVTKGVADAEIQVGGGLKATHTNKARIAATADVIIENEIIHSDIRTNGNCDIRGGFVRTSRITARRGIVARDVGSEISGPCVLKVGVDHDAMARFAHLKEQIAVKRGRQAELADLLAELEKRNASIDESVTVKAGEEGPLRTEQVELKRRLETLGDEGDGAERDALVEKLEELEKTLSGIGEAVAALFEEQEEVSDEIARNEAEAVAVENEIAEMRKASEGIAEKLQKGQRGAAIEILGTIYRKNTVSGAHAKLVLPENHSGIRITEGFAADAKSSVSWAMRIAPIR